LRKERGGIHGLERVFETQLAHGGIVRGHRAVLENGRSKKRRRVHRALESEFLRELRSLGRHLRRDLDVVRFVEAHSRFREQWQAVEHRDGVASRTAEWIVAGSDVPDALHRRHSRQSCFSK
jgi:hypothetical protein